MFPLMLTITFIYLCKEPKIKSYCTTIVCFLLLVNMFCYYTCSHLLYFYGEKHFVCLMPIKYLYCIVLYYQMNFCLEHNVAKCSWFVMILV